MSFETFQHNIRTGDPSDTDLPFNKGSAISCVEFLDL